MACFVKRKIIASDMIKVPWWTYMKKFALKLFKEEEIILICLTKDTSQCFGFFFPERMLFQSFYFIPNNEP